MRIKDVKYVRIILTNRCNFSCYYCHKEGCDYVSKDIDPQMIIKIVDFLYGLGYRKVKLMGGEPMLYEYIDDIVKLISKKADDIDLSLVSNGSAPFEKYCKLIELGLRRINISVHGWNKDYFVDNTGASENISKVVKRNIINLSNKGFLGKINYVLQKNKNEKDFYDLLEFVREYNLVIDVLNLLLPANDDSMRSLHYTFEEIESLIRSNYIVKSEMIYDNIYSLSSKRLFLEGGGVINLKINQVNQQNLFEDCTTCYYKTKCIEGIKAIRITNNAILQPCLLRNDNVLDLKDINEKEIINYLLEL